MNKTKLVGGIAALALMFSLVVVGVNLFSAPAAQPSSSASASASETVPATDDAQAAVTPEKASASSSAESFVPNQVVIQLQAGATEADAQALAERSSCLQADTISLSGAGTDAPILTATVAENVTVDQAIQELSGQQQVANVQKNYVYHLLEASDAGDGEDDAALSGLALYPSDPDRSQQWYLDAIGAYDAWSVTTSDQRVTVAVIDSGIDMNHPDLKDNIVGAYDAVGDSRTDSTASVPDESPDDELGHGTHVAGIACGVTDNGVGIAGVSYNANVLPIKVFYYSALSAGYVAATADIAAGFNYLLGDAGDGSGQTIAQRYNVRVINMSLGSTWNDDTDEEDLLFLDLIDRANAAGILVVCAAGNDDEPLPYKSFPSDYETCVSVIALSDASTRAYFSNYGPEKDISAPGARILSTVPSSYSSTGYAYMNGTSMASPVVAGAAALLFAANPSLTPDQAKQVLYSTATDLGAPGKDSDFGHGALDLKTAVTVAQGISNTPVSSISGFPTQGKVGEPLALYATVRPAEANQQVIFTVKDAGVTGAALTNGRVLASHEGTAVFCATVVGGNADGSNYVQEFSVSFSGSEQGIWNGTADVSWYDSQASAFEISTPEQLAGLAALVNGTAADAQGTALARDTFQGKTVRLTSDMYLNAASVAQRTDGMHQWVPIGDINGQGEQATEVFFDGVFDGQGHVLYNIYLDGAKSDDAFGGYQGLFGALGQHAVVSNVGLDGGWIFGRVAGGIAAVSHAETADWVPQITSCFNGATISGYGSSSRGTGGIFGGENQAGGHETTSAAAYRGACRISNCYNRGTIYGYVGGPAGGIAGIGAVEVTSCYNAGTVVSSGSYVGSVVGTLIMTGSGAVPSAAANFTPKGQVSASFGLAGSCANLYRYLNATHASTDNAGLVTANLLTSEELQGASALLGSAFVENPSGFPLLYWQVGAALTDLSAAVVDAIVDQLYTGLPVVPAITVRLADATEGQIVLQQGSDYAVTCENNVEVGTATLTVTGIGRYTGSVQTTFQVIKVDLSQCVIAAPAAQWYAGSEMTVDVTVTTPSGVVLRVGRDYAVTVDLPAEGSSATVTVSSACVGVEGSYVTTMQLVPVSTELSGSGIAADPYLISSKADLQFLANALNGGNAEYACASYKLTCDIVAASTPESAVAVDPLGVGQNGFGGTFDGDGHTITLGLSSDTISKEVGFSPDFNSLALFPTVRDRGSEQPVRISNLVLEGQVSSIGNASAFIGAGIASEIQLDSCVNRAAVTCGNDMSGAGFIAYTGDHTHLVMDGCVNQASISGGYYMAGFVAELAGEGCNQFTDCSNQGAITTQGHAGGLVCSFEPSVENSFAMERCCNTGAVVSTGTSGVSSVGGLLGFVQPDMDPGYPHSTITSCYNAGAISGKYAAGGLVGRLYYLSVDFGGVYNTATVTCTNDDRGDVAARPGGLVGMVAYEGRWTFSSAYNAGELVSAAGLASGGLVGWAFYGTTLEFDHAFYNSDESAVPAMSGVVLKPLPVFVGEATGVSPDGMIVAGENGFAAQLGESFVDDQNINNGLPVLYWQTDAAKRSLEAADVTVEAPEPQTFSGLPVTPSVTVRQGNYTLVAGADYRLTYENNTARGTQAVVNIAGIGRYSGTLTCTFEIGKGDIARCVVADIPDQFMEDGQACPSVTVTNEGGMTLVAGADYTVAYVNNTALTDEAQVVITGMGDYEGTQTATFAIVDQKWIQSQHVSAVASRQYTGVAIEPQVKVTVDGLRLVQDQDYTVAYANNVNVGQATLTVTGVNRYFGAVAVNFAITAADLSAARIDAIPQQTYTGQALEPAVAVWYNGALVPEEGYTVTYANNVAVGMASVTITGQGNYRGTRSANFLIVPEAEPEPEPEPVSVSVYVQEGEDESTKQLAGTLDADQLKDLVEEGSFSYLYSSDGTPKVLVTDNLVTLDALLGAFDLALEADDTLEVADALMASYSATGADIAASAYFFPQFTAKEAVTENAVEAPAGLALTWASAVVQDTAGEAAQEALQQQQTQDLRFAVGLSAQDYQAGKMAGSRFIRSVATVTLIKAEEPGPGEGVWEGKGTAARPYLIYDENDLAILSKMVYDATTYTGQSFAGIHFRLMNDIMPGEGLDISPIGYSANFPFSGMFDGDGHVVQVNITGGSTNGTGLFGYVSGTQECPAQISNLTVAGTVSSSYSYTSGLCGQAKGWVTINRCINGANVSSFKSYVGGILGTTADTSGCVTLSCCSNYGAISSTYASVTGYVGGIVGRMHATKNEAPSALVSCFNQGVVSGAGGLVGGVAGGLQNPASEGYLLNVTSCYNAAQVSTTQTSQETGALFGGTYLYGGGNAAGLAISNCFFLQGSGASAMGATLYNGAYPTAGTYTWEDAESAAQTNDYMTSEAFVAQLGAPYVAGDPYPVIGQSCLAIFRTQPQSASYSLKDSFTVAPLHVSVETRDGSDVSYQWYGVSADGQIMTEISGATMASYTPDLPKDAQGVYACGSWRYCCVVTDAQGVSATSQVATIAIWDGVTAETPVFVLDLEDVTVNQGSQASLQVEAQVKDGGQISYQWYSLDDEGKSTAIKGATGLELSLDTMTLGSIQYYCVATNTYQTEDNTAQTRSALCTVTVRPYTISTAQQLRDFAAEVSGGKTFEGLTVQLDADINMGGEVFAPIGDPDSPFQGIFDGQGHRIYGLQISGGSNSALFGALKGTSSWEKDHAVVKNLLVFGQVKSTGTRVAAIAANAGWATLEKVGSFVDVSSTSTSATSYVGGLVGACEDMSNITLTGCFSAGAVSSQGGRVGGLVADGGNSELTLTDCFTTGNVTGTIQVGGLVGTSTRASSWLRLVKLDSCYVAGLVSGTGTVGALMGLAPVYYGESSVSVTDCLMAQDSAATAFGSATGVVGTVGVVEAYDLMHSATALGDSYVTDNCGIHDGFPALTWENAAQPFIYCQPQEVTCFQGAAASSLVVEARPSGTGNALSYQWHVSSAARERGEALENATANLLSAVDTSAQGTFYYRCLVTEENGAQTWSLPGRVIVSQPAQAPVDVSVSASEIQAVQGMEGAEVTVSAVSPDGGVLSYQWYRAESAESAGQPLEGQTGATLKEFGTDLGTFYVYCVVTNTVAAADNAASAKSPRVKVTVNPLEIASAQDFMTFAAAVNAGTTFEGCTVRLTASVDLRSTANVVPVGNANASFLGTFDGGGNTISVALSGGSYTALFGHAGDESTQAIIENLLVSGVVSGTGSNTAAVVGWGHNVLLRNVGSSAKVTVTGVGFATAGLVGGAPTGAQAFIKLERCYNAGSVTSAGYDAAGLVGDVRNNLSTVTIIDSYNVGTIKAASFAGGLYGGDDYYEPMVGFARCYNAGTVQKTGSYGFAGALCGYAPAGVGKAVAVDCFMLDTSCAAAAGAGTLSASSVTAAELSAVPAALNELDAYRVATEEVPNKGFPVLRWQVEEDTPGVLGDINNNGKVNIVDAQLIYDLARGVPDLWDVLLDNFPDGASKASIRWIADVNKDSYIEAADAFAVQVMVHVGTSKE